MDYVCLLLVSAYPVLMEYYIRDYVYNEKWSVLFGSLEVA
jgi:hypothetical protein